MSFGPLLLYLALLMDGILTVSLGLANSVPVSALVSRVSFSPASSLTEEVRQEQITLFTKWQSDFREGKLLLDSSIVREILFAVIDDHQDQFSLNAAGFYSLLMLIR